MSANSIALLITDFVVLITLILLIIEIKIENKKPNEEEIEDKIHNQTSYLEQFSVTRIREVEYKLEQKFDAIAKSTNKHFIFKRETSTPAHYELVDLPKEKKRNP